MIRTVSTTVNRKMCKKEHWKMFTIILLEYFLRSLLCWWYLCLFRLQIYHFQVFTWFTDLLFPGKTNLLQVNYSVILFYIFKAVTICNMNLAQRSSIRNLLHNDEEYAVLQSICRNPPNEHVNNSVAGKWTDYKRVLLKVSLNQND